MRDNPSVKTRGYKRHPEWLLRSLGRVFAKAVPFL